MKGSVSTVVDVVFAWGFKKDHLDGTWKKKGMAFWESVRSLFFSSFYLYVLY